MEEPYVRWMIRRDLTDVLWIEHESFEYPWYETDFVRWLKQRNVIGMVAERSEEVVGFMIYELHKNRIHVRNLAVKHGHRRTGAGRALIGKLASKLSPDHRSRIMLEVRETNLDAQLFFKQLGFRAVSVLRDFYDETDEAAYLMSLEHNSRRINHIFNKATV